jgi:hypothetical protein
MASHVPTFRLVQAAWRALPLAAALLAAAPAALAQGQLSWVEVEIVVDGDGRAAVTYQVRWRTSGTMHGFYFQGEAARPRFRGGEAALPGGRTVPLSITPAGANRWDVVLAGGEAWGPGEAPAAFYDADLAAAGLVAVTDRLTARPPSSTGLRSCGTSRSSTTPSWPTSRRCPRHAPATSRSRTRPGPACGRSRG